MGTVSTMVALDAQDTVEEEESLRLDGLKNILNIGDLKPEESEKVLRMIFNAKKALSTG